KESGVIRIISAQLDPVAAGFPLQVYVMASLSRHDARSSRVFEDQIWALPQIITADNVAGEMDYVITAVARDVAELQELLANLATRGGQRLVTYLRLAEIKPPSRLPLSPTVPPAHPPPPPPAARRLARAAGAAGARPADRPRGGPAGRGGGHGVGTRGGGGADRTRQAGGECQRRPPGRRRGGERPRDAQAQVAARAGRHR